jgi:hypothetical protein
MKVEETTAIREAETRAARMMLDHTLEHRLRPSRPVADVSYGLTKMWVS